jgi:glycosyltransferase involved in cell wall biosynthesis
VQEPLVSVVTPFRNTAPYLAQCIESVLGQSYPNFEYLLSDNCSTDGSVEIAEDYARRDSRIRLIRQSKLYTQPQHYNRALAGISEASKYCKIVQADDRIFPECLSSMVQAFEQSESIGLVSSYYLKGDELRGSGYPNSITLMNGKEMARFYLRTGVFVFGSATTVMYRSALVRDCHPFYAEDVLHEDTEKCMDILANWDFGFVPQVLSFLRTDNANESISAGFRSFFPDDLDRYLVVRRYSPIFLESGEAEYLTRTARKHYYRFLAQEALKFRESAFWRYQESGLKSVGEVIEKSCLAAQIARRIASRVVNPGMAVARSLHSWRERRPVSKREAKQHHLPTVLAEAKIGNQSTVNMPDRQRSEIHV